jgi:hypothetical protein
MPLFPPRSWIPAQAAAQKSITLAQLRIHHRKSI